MSLNLIKISVVFYNTYMSLFDTYKDFPLRLSLLLFDRWRRALFLPTFSVSITSFFSSTCVFWCILYYGKYKIFVCFYILQPSVVSTKSEPIDYGRSSILLPDQFKTKNNIHGQCAHTSEVVLRSSTFEY